ncbi:DUF2497 domain-containing protein [Hyphococcus sp.]|jgi:hypothetical protein|uniref:DUF2497 domain-containing protein n=1 Tax=Hyphococcus sp. TaxID=2038636 RepID=UPI003D140010
MENAQPEPSMEEILASIRRIISEDEEDQVAAPAAKTAPAAPPAPPRPAAPAEEKPELTLTREEVRPAAPAPSARPQIDPEDEIEMVKQPMKAAAPMQHDSEDDILDRSAAAAASQAFQNLSQSVRISEGPGKTLEDIVTEMLRPMIKDWLDANLPAIVEEKVEEEVQRVARRRRG